MQTYQEELETFKIPLLYRGTDIFVQNTLECIVAHFHKRNIERIIE